MSEIPESVPEWLVTWLQIPFYEDNCRIHVNKYTTIFCGECIKGPICEICWKEESNEHKDHPVLQVRAASRRAAIEIKDIKKFLDISCIQHYKVNNKDILYLGPNKGGAVEGRQNPKCGTCKRRLITDDYKFCSIICKYESIIYQIEKRGSVDNESMRSTATDESMRNVQYSFNRARIHHRKSIPRRSPLQ